MADPDEPPGSSDGTPAVPDPGRGDGHADRSGAAVRDREADIRGIPTRTWKTAPATLRAVLELSAPHGDKDFLVYEDERITFAEHFRTVATLAHALIERFGVDRGDRVAIAMRNLPEWVMAFWAAISVGAVVVPLNAWWMGEELAYGLRDSGSKVVFVDEERRDRIAPHLDDVPDLEAMIVTCEEHDPDGGRRGRSARTSTGHGADPLPVIPFAEVLEAAPPRTTLPDVAIDPDDDATIFYTSGTTGQPKGAVGTHRNSVSNLMNLFFVATVGSMRRSGDVANLAPAGRTPTSCRSRSSTPPAAMPCWSPTPPPAASW